MSNDRYRKEKRRNRFRLALALFTCTILLIILVLLLILIVMDRDQKESQMLQSEPVSEVQSESAEETEPAAQTEPVTERVTEEPVLPGPAPVAETDIYTFMQGPKAWEGKVDFSGSWCHEFLADQEFSVFGCGLCVLANIYSTLTPYDCSPLDMYYYAQEVSGYRPVSGYGAIDWPYLKQTLKSVGISSRLRYKGSSYLRFRQIIERSIGAIVLISSAYDDTYWHDVEGHYVTIWLYNREDDTVFLSDSGNPDHNRQRIPLRYIYDALKKSSSYQYLAVTDVDPEANTWQHDGINIKWKKPKYYKKLKNRLR